MNYFPALEYSHNSKHQSRNKTSFDAAFVFFFRKFGAFNCSFSHVQFPVFSLNFLLNGIHIPPTTSIHRLCRTR